MSVSTLRVLHIYAQASWHSPALLYGNRTALTALRDALNAVLDTGETQNTLLFVNDGEGYDCYVAMNDDHWQSPLWLAAPEPYADDTCCGDMERWDREWLELWRRIGALGALE